MLTHHTHPHRTAWRTLALALAAVATLGLAACTTTQPASEQVSDATITSQVKSKLTADPEINPLNIDVDTTDGVVALRGRVPTAEDSREAEKLARNTGGVVRVDNQLRVGEAETEQVPGTDAAIATRVNGALATSTDVSARNIDVDVQDGIVTLSGVVKTQAAKERAHDIAHEVKGVTTVYNEIQVRPPTQ